MTTATKEWRHARRSEIIQTRKKLTAEEVSAASTIIRQKVLNHPFLQQPRLIASYMSFSGEIDTITLNDDLLQHQHTMCLPVISPTEKGIMHFYSYRSKEELQENRFHILEPVPSVGNRIDPPVIEVILVPLVGFNKVGDRLGMGGGYYDRMLKKISSAALTLGLAYDFQYVKDLEHQPWDVPLDEIITPTEHIICSRKY